MMASSSLSFDAIVDALQNAGAISDPAEMHGSLCGLACVLGANAQSLWMADILTNGGDPVADEAARCAGNCQCHHAGGRRHEFPTTVAG